MAGGILKKLPLWFGTPHAISCPLQGRSEGEGGCSQMVFSERRTPRLTPMDLEVGLDMPRNWTTVGLEQGPVASQEAGPAKSQKHSCSFYRDESYKRALAATGSHTASGHPCC